ncbi:phosphoribosylamine--glycine ligase [Candidatus Pacearchaeota archaeon]|nr:phosphoribosylamine--glycine ligase [Candidatus Pacearchaeota archaeon]
MKAMIIGKGMREHALALAHLTGGADEVFVAPGNSGMNHDFINQPLTGRCLPLLTDETVSLNTDSVLSVAQHYKPDFIEVAPDRMLAEGLVDVLTSAGFRVFGPTRKASRIEWDKAWSREFMRRQGISCPEYRIYRKGDDCRAYIQYLIQRDGKAFLKASGLYEGKGVIGVKNSDEIEHALKRIDTMGSASDVFLVEEGMKGEEFSFHVLVHKGQILSFKSTQDHKQIFVNDTGENTGGMGAYAPALVTAGLEQKILDKIIMPAVHGLEKEDIPYTGMLYLGGMRCTDERIRVVEFNARWGDPECHAILPGIAGGTYHEMILAIVNQQSLPSCILEDTMTRISIVGAAKGYPEAYEQGKQLSIDYTAVPSGVNFLSGGIEISDGIMYTAGGRIFSAVAHGADIIHARERAKSALKCCSVEDKGLHWRDDIGWRDAERAGNKV